jgi:hypothetical protein
MRRADLISAGVLLVLALVTIFLVIPTYVTGNGQNADLSPAFMPYVAAVLGAAALVMLLGARLARRVPDDAPPPLPKESWLFIGAAAVVLAATFVLLDSFGYLAGAAAIVAGFMALARAERKVVVGATIAFPLALWLLFDRLLGFPLP